MPSLPSGPSVGIPPAAASRLLDALVERWVRRATPPDGEPRLSLWSYDAGHASLVGRWSSSPRVVQRLDAWMRADVVDRLVAPVAAGTGPRDRVLVWERAGRPEVRGADLAWYAAWRTCAHGDGAVFLVVTRAGWVSVPDATVGPRRSRRTAR
ncbi:hypothetical protein [Mumia sp.]|uniref:hypothetical protein n=1 Tax=Mumia sp. TaxID=1965300 RepID=UPI002632ECB6|nr:hypothetical protein [Mumia sp.]MDD9350069.1 hypothetical protein [Mumia sp.]